MTEIEDRIYKENNGKIPKQTIQTVVSAFQDAIRSDLMAGRNVHIRGLCTFEVMDVPERTRRSFGKDITTSARKDIKARVATKLREAVKNL
jgi:nucleoid DNA-binding protein